MLYWVEMAWRTCQDPLSKPPLDIHCVAQVFDYQMLTRIYSCQEGRKTRKRLRSWRYELCIRRTSLTLGGVVTDIHIQKKPVSSRTLSRKETGSFMTWNSVNNQVGTATVEARLIFAGAVTRRGWRCVRYLFYYISGCYRKMVGFFVRPIADIVCFDYKRLVWRINQPVTCIRWIWSRYCPRSTIT